MSSTENTTTTTTVESTADDHEGTDTRVYHWTDREYRKLGDGESFVYEHQLTACLNNSPYKVFHPHMAVHHETGFKGDNRDEALSVLTTGEHGRLHSKYAEWTEVDDEPRLRMIERPLDEYGIGSD